MISDSVITDLIQSLNDDPEAGDQLAQLLAQRIQDFNNAASLREAEHRVQVRILSAGGEVVNDATGIGRDVLAHSEFDTLNFSGTVTVNADNPRQADITTGGITGGGVDCEYDYWVSNCFTVATALTTFAGCTVYGYPTLFGTGGALEAAISRGGNLAIFICNSETITTSMNLNDWLTASSTNITITGAGDHKVVLTANGCHMFTGLSQANAQTLITPTSLYFRNVDLAVVGVFALQGMDCDGTTRHIKFWYDTCDIQIPSGYLHTDQNGRAIIDNEMIRCTGTIHQLYRDVQSPAFGWGDLTLRGCALSFGILYNGVNQFDVPAFYWYDSTVTVLTPWVNTASIGQNYEWILDGVTIIYNGSGTAWSAEVSAGSGIGDVRLDFRDVTYITSTANTQFLALTKSVIGAGADPLIFFDNVRGMASASQSSATFITVASTLTNSWPGMILAPQWQVAYTGPNPGGSGGGGASNGEPFVTYAASAALTANRVLTGSAAIQIQNTGADDGSIFVNHLGVVNAGVLPDAHHNQNHAPTDHTKEIARMYLPFGSAGVNGYAVVL